MENLYNRIRQSKIVGKLPSKKQINQAISSFSKKEWIIFSILGVVLCLSTLIILENINKSFMVQVPTRGGEISIGVVGTPRFINPVLDFSDADNDLTALIYSGLMRKTPDGNLIPDLAEGYTVSKDGLTYTFTLKNNLSFQDGAPLTADDVIFTINEVKDPTIQSPRAVNWDGISISKTDNRTVVFTLKQPYASFLDNTTLGILPEHLWNNSPIELNNANTNPVGSGPYTIKGVNKESSGSIDSYELAPFKKFALGQSYIKNMNLYFYSNENDLIKALENGEVDQVSSISPGNAEILKTKGYQVSSSVLPRIFGLFFNQNVNRLFTDKTILSAINQTIDKDAIVQKVLFGYGTTIDSPIPPSIVAYQSLSGMDGVSRAQVLQNVESALAKDGWTKGADGFLQKTVSAKKVVSGKKAAATKTAAPSASSQTSAKLEFSISTSNAPDLAETAELIKENLAEVGIKVDIKTFDTGDLNQSVIRPRQYDSLLFGEIINNESDLFAFWDSSQRKDPGLNVAMYTNAKVDKLLENAFISTDEQTRTKDYLQFEDQIRQDMPAVFLYSPDFIYIVPDNLKGITETLTHITSPADRFSDVYNWYTQTEDVWKIFAR